MLPAAIVSVALLAVLNAALHFIPFEFPSYALYAGLMGAAIGVLLCFPRSCRKAGVFMLTAGLCVAVTGLIWPCHVSRASSHTAIDEFLPEYHFREFHSATIPGGTDLAMRAIQATTFGDLQVYRVLMSIRQIAGGHKPNPQANDRPILATMAGPRGPFSPLAERDRELVFGALMKPSGGIRRIPADQFAAFHEPGWVKVAWNIRVVEDAAGVRVSTETRILATDDASARQFSRYWHAVYPGTAIIRRMWLRAIAERAHA